MPLPWKRFATWHRDRHLKQTEAQRRQGEAHEDVAEAAQHLGNAAAPPRHLVPDRGDAGQNAAPTLA